MKKLQENPNFIYLEDGGFLTWKEGTIYLFTTLLWLAPILHFFQMDIPQNPAGNFSFLFRLDVSIDILMNISFNNHKLLHVQYSV